MKPTRQAAKQNGSTYFVTSQTRQRKPFFRHKRWAELFLKTLYGYRGSGYLLHEFVLMPDHFHILITPSVTLERAVQLIKGGFSRRASLELEPKLEIWRRGFSDHRIRDADDYRIHVGYIHRNPVKTGFCAQPQEYVYNNSARKEFERDRFPQGLKPRSLGDDFGTAEAVPLQPQTGVPVSSRPNRCSFV